MAAMNTNIMYNKIQLFLTSRGIEYLLSSFMINKIVDFIAPKCNEEKLAELGLMYGDILAFKEAFPSQQQENKVVISSYEEKALELRKKIQSTHTRVKSKSPGKSISIGLKCMERGKYTLKQKHTFTKIFDENTTYESLHEEAQDHFGISSGVDTYLAYYNGKRIKDSFINTGNLISKFKDKKRIANIYLYYPLSYNKLVFKKYCSDVNKTLDDSSDSSEDLSFMKEIKSTELNVESPLTNLENPQEELNFEYPFTNLENIPNEERTSTRSSQMPVRFRHSIGSPSLLLANSARKETQEFSTTTVTKTNCFGDGEADRFFESFQEQKNIEHEQQTNFTKDDLYQFIENAQVYSIFTNESGEVKENKPLIVQRDRFWSVLFRQIFDFAKHNPIIRFAGESGADAGGLNREFLNLAMSLFHEAPNMFFGSKDELFFKSAPFQIQNGNYYLLGQLTAMSILSIGQGPHCLNQAVVDACFDKSYQVDFSKIEDGQLKYNLDMINNKQYDCLYEANIVPELNSDANNMCSLYANHYCIHSRFAAISNFKAGVESISPVFVQKQSYPIMKSLLVVRNTKLLYDTFIDLFEFHKEGEIGSNIYIRCEELICEFELFIAGMFTGDQEVKPEELLLFITGSSTIPLQGFEKKIDIYFEDISLPKASTCGLNLSLPKNNIIETLKIALAFGGGFGDV